MLQFDEEELIRHLTDFYKLTGIKICVCDDEGTEISYAPEHLCAFCEYVRSSNAGLAACRGCDENAFAACRRTAKPAVYSCHMGLTECVSPIVQQGQTIGFIMIGQTADGTLSDFEKIRPLLLSYGLDADKAKSLYDKIEFSPAEKVRAAVSVMDAIAGYLYLNNLISSGENTGKKIANFVRENISGDLSVERLCRAFKLSRVDLYACCKHAFGSTPADYVRAMRLERACELLHTPLPVTRIAQQVGVCDYNYFSKIFKARYGVSPREYRKKHALRRE